jgi:hypothetical protein
MQETRALGRTVIVSAFALWLLSLPSPGPIEASLPGSATSEDIMTDPLLAESAPIASYATYTNTHFRFSVQVPSDWQLDEHFTPDDTFAFVCRYTFTGPPDSVSHVGFTELEFREVPTAEFGGVYATLAAYASATIPEKNVVGGTVVSDVATTILGLPAREIQIEYSESRPEHEVLTPDPQVPVTVRQKWITFEKDRHFHEIGLISTTADWALYEPAYTTAKSTIAFLP